MKKTMVLLAAFVMLYIPLLTGCTDIINDYESAQATPAAAVQATPAVAAPHPH